MFPYVGGCRLCSKRMPRSDRCFPSAPRRFSARSSTNQGIGTGFALHQDHSIPVQERVVQPDCSGWSEKEAVLYVQPPVAVLESLVAVRAHLDDCGAASGPRVALLPSFPDSHRHGRLSDDPHLESIRTRCRDIVRTSRPRPGEDISENGKDRIRALLRELRGHS
jgi:hypothetical protein